MNTILPELPELGPRVVFFTGGTALRALSQALTKYTHNSVHLVTPFDSGGSSARLRRAFGIPAVGDMRNRLLALADTAFTPVAVCTLLARRLPLTQDRDTLLHILYGLASEKDPSWDSIPRIFGEVLRVHLRYFLERMPPHFDPCGACVGNLILAGGYLHHAGNFGPTLALLNRLLRVHGIVLPIVGESLHLAAELADNSVVVGQHRITKRENNVTALPAPVKRIFLTVHDPESPIAAPQACTPHVTPLAATYIRAADMICFPMGSFYTSVLANLLPVGVGAAVAEARCPKVYIPNTGQDPEQARLSVADAVRVLLDTLRCDAGPVPTKALLHTVLVDTAHGHYPRGIDADAIRAQGVDVQDTHLLAQDQPDAEHHDPELTARALLGLLPGA